MLTERKTQLFPLEAAQFLAVVGQRPTNMEKAEKALRFKDSLRVINPDRRNPDKTVAHSISHYTTNSPKPTSN